MRREWRGGFRDGRQRGEARTRHHRKLRQSRTHEGAVDARQRDHIANRREADEVDVIAQIRFDGIVRHIPPAVAKLAVQRHHEKERHARGAQIAKVRRVARLVRIDLGKSRRKRFDGVMIQHDHIESRVTGGGERSRCRGTAIDGDDQRRALFPQCPHRIGVGAVAFCHAVGDIDTRPVAQRGEETCQQRGRTGAVHIVVAEHRDLLTGIDRGANTRDGTLHVLQHERFRQQPLQGRIEDVFKLVCCDVTRRQNARQRIADVPRNRQCARLVVRDLAQPPAPAREGAGYPKCRGRICYARLSEHPSSAHGAS